MSLYFCKDQSFQSKEYDESNGFCGKNLVMKNSFTWSISFW